MLVMLEQHIPTKQYTNYVVLVK